MEVIRYKHIRVVSECVAGVEDRCEACVVDRAFRHQMQQTRAAEVHAFTVLRETGRFQ